MRVVVTLRWLAMNGVSVFCAHLVRGLRRHGHDAELVVTDDAAPPGHAPFPVPADVPFSVLPKAPVAQRREMLRRLLEARRPCVYLPNGDQPLSPIGHELSAGVRTVAMIHNDCARYFELLSELAPSCAAIVAVSQVLATRVCRAVPEFAPLVTAIPHGIEAPPVLPIRQPDSGPLRVVYVGRVEQEQKRVLDVLAAVAMARRQGADVEFTVAGVGTHVPVLKAIAERAAIPVRLAGMLGPAAVHDLFARSHVNLLPSDYEGFAISLLEGMAAGCVPLASRIEAGFREFVREGETGLLAEPRDVSGFASALCRLAGDRGLLEKLARQGVALSREPRYSVGHMVAAYERVFERVLGLAEAGPR